jgi:hypothetical protein
MYGTNAMGREGFFPNHISNEHRPAAAKEGSMLRKVVAMVLVLVFPVPLSAGPLKVAAEKAVRELAVEQHDTRSRGRFWTGIALIAGGGVLAALGSVELGDDETGPDDGEDLNDSDDGEDSDGWGNKAMLGGGIAAATIGGVILLTGRNKGGPVVSAKPGAVVVRQTVSF